MLEPYAQAGFRVRCDWGPAGADAVGRGARIVAVVDVLSFTTALTVAADRGIEVFPYRWRDGRAAAFAAQHQATLAVGRSEVGPDRPVSLSPATIRSCAGVARLVLPSPNGSTIARRLAELGTTVIGVSLRNARAAAAWTARQIDGETAVAVIPAGERWRADGSLRPAVEDLWGAGAFVAGLVDEGIGQLSPEADVAATAYRRVAPSIGETLRECASGRELIGYGYPEDVEIAAEVGASDVVPVLSGEHFQPGSRRPLLSARPGLSSPAMTSESLVQMHGVSVLVLPPDGPQLQNENDAVDLIAKAIENGAELVLVPVERFTDDFFTLRTRLAGEFVQKFVNYRLRLVVVGDVSQRLAKSSALRDFVGEANRGNQLWFVATQQDLDQRLAAGSG